MIWNEALECMPRTDLERLQGERLADLVQRLGARSGFYRRAFESSGVRPEAVHGFDALPTLPFTRKSDLRDNYPFGLFALPICEIARLHASTGTTGKPTLVGYTRHDLHVWAELCARCLAMSGARPGMIFQNAYGYGLFTGGLGLHAGAELLGMTVIPASAGKTSRQVLLLRDLGSQILGCTPSYALTLADALDAQGVKAGTTALRALLLGAEPWTEEMRAEIEARLRVDALNIYGLSEVMGPGVANECVESKNGSHVFEDHFIVEVIDPKGTDRLRDGEIGELVFTTLTKQGLPLLRYRTGDLASVSREPCRCGRTHARISRIIGRTDDMLIIRGINVFPSQVEAALAGVPELAPHYELVVTRPARLDELEVRVEVRPEFFQEVGVTVFRSHGKEPCAAVAQLEGTIRRRLQDMLGLHVRASLKEPRELARSDGSKLCRVVDRRSPDPIDR